LPSSRASFRRAVVRFSHRALPAQAPRHTPPHQTRSKPGLAGFSSLTQRKRALEHDRDWTKCWSRYLASHTVHLFLFKDA
jgi:hypothetical protein